ncbi:MAG TPA: hypothetical protein VNT55_14110, partial [Baekduia sp.]|nr:hypothetical protein [Baekduia sp.]
GSGGGAVAFGGAGAGAGAGAGVVGTGAVATKVAAVVAAAAVVGGGAATVEKVEHAVKRPAAVYRSHTVVKHPAPQASLPDTQRTVAAAQHLTVPASVKHVAKKTAPAVAPTRAAHLRAAAGTAVSSPGRTDVPALEPTSGGLEAPADDATTANATTPTDPGGSGTATAGTETESTTGAGSTATASDPSASSTPTSTSSSSTSASPTTSTGTPASPSGTVSSGATGPVAQGAAAAPAG